ncbi:MAG: accessory Sec system glycosyltransferase GtfA [Coriobacteriales bacterium]|nr:accessory Sec system glycosyltransferase GtfA [Coriobacteriales bacterium]
MIYNFNLGIGWASSGVEYAQVYRAKMFRVLHEPARFIFTDMFPQENIEHLTSNIGFVDDEIIWLYTYFTDFKIAPVTYTLEQFQSTLKTPDGVVTRSGKTGRLQFSDSGTYCSLYFADKENDALHRVEYVSNGCLIRKDYFTYGRIYSEYYAPLDGRAHLYLRRFFNEDGTVAYEEMPSGKNSLFRFPDHVFFSKEDLVGYFVQSLGLTGDDTVIIDRTTGIGQAILQNAGAARVGIVVHADHYSQSATDDTHILWNNYYEYPFDLHRHIDFFTVSTKRQKELLEEQFARYVGEVPEIDVIPVGGLDHLVHPAKPRTPYSIVTASRLASEKHLDWVIEACTVAKEQVPELTLDICGAGAERQRLAELIHARGAEGYIRLLGQQDMSAVYPRYELYLSGSTSEGFGLSLLEAVGSGLALIGFDVPYGNPAFIDDGRNGHLIPVHEAMTEDERVRALANRIVQYFLHDDREAFERRSYEIAEDYLTERVAQRWKGAIRA